MTELSRKSRRPLNTQKVGLEVVGYDLEAEIS